MSLPVDLLSQFVKITNDESKKKNDTIAYGTLYKESGKYYVQIDGSSSKMPVSTSNIAAGTNYESGKSNRVVVLIKNHSVIIMGSLEASGATVTTLEGVRLSNLDLETLKADYGAFKELAVGKFTAYEAEFVTINADFLTVGGLISANAAEIASIKTNYLTAEQIKSTYATIEKLESDYVTTHSLEATYGEFKRLTTETLETHKAVIESLDTDYAEIDFANIGQAAIEKIFASTGLITNMTIEDGHVTGKLSAVTIDGGLINASTLKADRLIIKGVDGLYYQLNANTNGVTQTQLATEEYQSKLHGGNIIAKTITADQIKVSDLEAFGATIGGFKVSETSLYSGAKSSISNTTSGVYMDKDGKFVVGGPSEYIKYDGSALSISISDITINTTALTVLLENAAKSATDFVRLGDSGLMVGDLIKQTLGKNVLIDSDSVDIRDGETTLASFESNRIRLGNNNADSVIDLCNGAGTITVIPSENGDSYPYADNLVISSRALDVVGERFVGTGYAVRTDENISGEVYVQGDCARLTAGIEYTGSETRNSSKVGVSALPSDTSANGRLLLYASERAKGDINSVVTENQVNIYPSYTNFGKKIRVGGVDITGAEVQDSGWKTATLASGFTLYNSGESVKYRKIGKMVEVNGVVKPTSAIAGSTDNYTIFTLPSGYRPHRQVSYRCQGSGTNSWLFTITAAGVVRFSRYNNGSSYAEAGTGAWLPFNATFFIE